jgi:hypothetical protein
MDRSPNSTTRRFPQAVRALRRDEICVEFVVALSLVASTVALIFAMSVDTSFAEVVRHFAGRMAG